MITHGPSRLLGPMDIRLQTVPDSGVLYARSPHELPLYPRCLTDRLAHWAEAAPERTFLAQRDDRGEWRGISYQQALSAVRAIGQALLDRDLSRDRPVMVLSGNDIEHALLGLAAQYVGVPHVPVSPSYALASGDFGKLRHVVESIGPGLVFAADASAFAVAVEAVVPAATELVATRGHVDGRPVTAFRALADTSPGEAVNAAHGAVDADTVAKILYTSGSTGMPKGVINTQGMLCSNQAMLRSYFAFLQAEPPTLLDWLPWHHTFGGNHNFGLVLYNGGTLYIDEGRPTPDAVEHTLRNLETVSPTLYFNVPKGYEALLPHLRERPELAERMFSNLRVLFCAAAALPGHVWEALDAIARSAKGEPVPVLSGYGATETAPSVLFTTLGTAAPGAIGLPVPGVDLKLVPFEGRYELRVRGPNVTPGYWRQPDKTREVFDEEGYYCLGDALQFVDADEPGRGFRFDGRLADNFKLSSGTWVNVGQLRARFIAECAPLIRDVVIAGENRDYLTAVVIPDPAACERTGAGDTQALRSRLRACLADHMAAASGSSTCIRRLVLLETPLSLDAGEVTDKGSVNQRAVRRLRQELIDRMYADPPPEDVVVG